MTGVSFTEICGTERRAGEGVLAETLSVLPVVSRPQAAHLLQSVHHTAIKVQSADLPVLACIAGIILMCLLQCAFQWLKCWTNSCCFCINVGRWCGRKATDEKSRMCCKSCFLRCGACCVATDKCRVGRHAAAEAAEKRLVAYSGIDTSYLTRCGGPVEDDPEKAQAQRLGPWINDKVGCTLVPGKWGRVKKIADLQKEVRESKKIIDDIRDALGPERRQKFLGGIRYLQEAADKAEQAIGGAARKASSRTHSVSSGKSRSGKRGRKRDSQGS